MNNDHDDDDDDNDDEAAAKVQMHSLAKSQVLSFYCAWKAQSRVGNTPPGHGARCEIHSGWTASMACRRAALFQETHAMEHHKSL